MRRFGLFPGQGSQVVGMGKSLARTEPAARAVFDRADESLRRAMWEGPEADLVRTDRTQPALFLHSIAALEALTARGIRIDSAAGHSVGEFAALVAAGALSFDTAWELVNVRARAMQACAERHPGGMSALLGIGRSEADEACRRASEKGICVAANDNCPGQIVLSGEKAALDAAAVFAKELGARKVIPLAVAGAWHSPLMEEAAIALGAAMARSDVKEPAFPVWSNVEARPYRSAREVRELLVRQVVSPVRFREILVQVAGEEPVFCEIGTGKVLTGLLKKVNRKASVEEVPS